jgi:hypothetical protein
MQMLRVALVAQVRQAQAVHRLLVAAVAVAVELPRLALRVALVHPAQPAQSTQSRLVARQDPAVAVALPVVPPADLAVIRV